MDKENRPETVAARGAQPQAEAPAPPLSAPPAKPPETDRAAARPPRIVPPAGGEIPAAGPSTADAPAPRPHPGAPSSAGRIAPRAPANVAQENPGPRADSYRQMPTVVIDQAATDPSLRFLLIAAAIFILFVVFWSFNYLIR
jgi:hypothetical protein